MAVYMFVQTMKRMRDSVDVIKKQLLEETVSPVRYIFTTITELKDIRECEKVGIEAEQIVSMYQCFTDNHGLDCSVKAEDKLNELKSNLQYTYANRMAGSVSLVKGVYEIASMILDEENGEYCREISYYNYTRLLRKEIYTNGIAYVDYYITAKAEGGLYAKLTRRTFYNVDGSAAYDQIFEGEKEWFVFPDGGIFTKEQLAMEFIKRLDLSEQDTILLDDSVPDEFVQAVFTFGKAAQIVILAHFERDRKDDAKKCLYGWFPYAEAIHTIVVSTEGLKKLLLKELEKYHCKVPDIMVIPMESEFASMALYEANEGNLVLLWHYNGNADGFRVYDEFGKRICERRDIYQHYFLIKGCGKKKGIVIKTFADTLKGPVVTAKSETIYVSGNKKVNVMGILETLEYVRDKRISAARFGDGEIKQMCGVSIGYQEYDEELAKRLKQVITMPDNNKLLVCLPDIFEKMDRYKAIVDLTWKQHLKWHQDVWAEIITSEKYYGNAFISRPYMDLADKSMCGKYFQSIKELFANEDILIVEGFYSRSGVGNDLFEGARSVKRIICPSRNAYSKYEVILDTVRKHGMDKLILIMLGPTAKVLAYDLALEGYWAVDIGHIDSEYEWYKMGAVDKIRIGHKHTAESEFADEHITLQNDDTYAREIVAMLSDES
ncbi:MAG: SP_1767 family glycosyltransferase [Lachnospiraceae bacterium]|jgi:glycosyltransferase family protein|nr:SP_1767 family glycosyltransferase [Lachnospiraceae bacterium]